MSLGEDVLNSTGNNVGGSMSVCPKAWTDNGETGTKKKAIARPTVCGGCNETFKTIAALKYHLRLNKKCKQAHERKEAAKRRDGAETIKVVPKQPQTAPSAIAKVRDEETPIPTANAEEVAVARSEEEEEEEGVEEARRLRPRSSGGGTSGICSTLGRTQQKSTPPSTHQPKQSKKGEQQQRAETGKASPISLRSGSLRSFAMKDAAPTTATTTTAAVGVTTASAATTSNGKKKKITKVAASTKKKKLLVLLSEVPPRNSAPVHKRTRKKGTGVVTPAGTVDACGDQVRAKKKASTQTRKTTRQWNSAWMKKKLEKDSDDDDDGSFDDEPGQGIIKAKAANTSGPVERELDSGESDHDLSADEMMDTAARICFTRPSAADSDGVNNNDCSDDDDNAGAVAQLPSMVLDQSVDPEKVQEMVKLQTVTVDDEMILQEETATQNPRKKRKRQRKQVEGAGRRTRTKSEASNRKKQNEPLEAPAANAAAAALVEKPPCPLEPANDKLIFVCQECSLADKRNGMQTMSSPIPGEDEWRCALCKNPIRAPKGSLMGLVETMPEDDEDPNISALKEHGDVTGVNFGSLFAENVRRDTNVPPPEEEANERPNKRTSSSPLQEIPVAPDPHNICDQGTSVVPQMPPLIGLSVPPMTREPPSVAGPSSAATCVQQKLLLQPMQIRQDNSCIGSQAEQLQFAKSNMLHVEKSVLPSLQQQIPSSSAECDEERARMATMHTLSLAEALVSNKGCYTETELKALHKLQQEIVVQMQLRELIDDLVEPDSLNADLVASQPFAAGDKVHDTTML